MAVLRIRSVAGALGQHAVRGLYAWHAGPLFQVCVSVEAHQEMALLGTCRVLGAAGRLPRAVYLEGGETTGRRELLSSSLERLCSPVWSERASGRFGDAKGGVLREMPCGAEQAVSYFS